MDTIGKEQLINDEAKKPKIGLFLTGGGAIGAFHFGVIEALDELGIEYQFVYGCSAGAIAAAGLKEGIPPERMKEIWKSLTVDKVFHVKGENLKNYKGKLRTLKLWINVLCQRTFRGPVSIEEFEKLLTYYLSNEELKTNKEKGRKRTIAVSSSISPFNKGRDDRWKLVVFYDINELGEIIKRTAISMRMPIFDRKKIIDDTIYTDLCRFRPYPFHVLRQAKCDRAIISNSEVKHFRRRRLDNRISKYFAKDKVKIFNFPGKPSILGFFEDQTDTLYEQGRSMVLEEFKDEKVLSLWKG